MRGFDHDQTLTTNYRPIIVNRLKEPLIYWVSVTFTVTASQPVC